jgi:hypothetical protein
MPEENLGWKRPPTLRERADGSHNGSRSSGRRILNRRHDRQLRRSPDQLNTETLSGAVNDFDSNLHDSNLHDSGLYEAGMHDSGARKEETQVSAVSTPGDRWQKLASAFGPGRPLRYLSLALVVAVMIAVSFLKPIDQSSESQLDSALTRALIGFGIARTLNGVISVAQGTEFAVQPAGVGVNFSPGEILDPVNDLVERFSWVMLLATSSLGIQKILLEVSSWIGISFMLAGAGLFWLLTRWRSGAASDLANLASRILLIILLIRFLIPLGSLANDWVYQRFLQPKFEVSSQQLEVAGNRIREINSRNSEAPAETDTFRQKAKNLYQSVTSKFDFDGMLNDYKESAESVTEHAVNLIVVFVLQTVIFPLVFLYLVYRLFKFLILPNSPRFANRQ